MTQAGFLTSLDLEHRFYHRESGQITGEIVHLSLLHQNPTMNPVTKSHCKFYVKTHAVFITEFFKNPQKFQ